MPLLKKSKATSSNKSHKKSSKKSPNKSSKKSANKSSKKSANKSSKKSPKKVKSKRKSVKKSKTKSEPVKGDTKKMTFEELMAKKKADKLSAEKKVKDQEKLKKESEKEEALLVKRYEKVITPYIKDLEKKMKEKGQHYFVWDDNLSKRVYKTHDEMKKDVLANTEKYNGKHLFQIGITFPYSYRNTDKSAGFIHKDTWMILTIQMYKIDKSKSTLNSMYQIGCILAWHTKDFAITKFSYKFNEFIMQQLEKRAISCGSIGGLPVHIFLERLKEKNIKIPKDILKPLAGL